MSCFYCWVLSHIAYEFHGNVRNYKQIFFTLKFNFVQKAGWLYETEARTKNANWSYSNLSLRISFECILASKNEVYWFLYCVGCHCWFIQKFFFNKTFRSSLQNLEINLHSEKKTLVSLWTRHLVLKYIT